MAERWTDDAPELAALEPLARARLERHQPVQVPDGAVLFQPGDAVRGYVVVLEGRVEVRLAGPTGRDILLYAVEPGQACIQSTLGLLGGDDHYSAQAVADGPARVVLLPRDDFLALVEDSPAFRKLVFAALAARMQSTMQMLETLSFLPVGARLSKFLLERAEMGTVHATHQEIATAIGSAREVVSRQIERLARAGAVRPERGRVVILSAEKLRQMADDAAL